MRKSRWLELIRLRETWLTLALTLGLTGEAMAARTSKPRSKSHRHSAGGKSPAPAHTLSEQIVVGAEMRASPDGKAVLETGKKMIHNRELGAKGCWDYINKVYSRAGYPSKKRAILYQSRKKGPYSNLEDIQPGDWVYYVNHSYKNVEHSAIFVDWINRERKEALMLSYAGENRSEAARYKTYDLSSVYRIIRPRPASPAKGRPGSAGKSKRVARR